MSGRILLVVILFAATATLPAAAETLDTQPLIDFTATRFTGEPWQLNSGGGTVTAEWFINAPPDTPSFDARGVFEFDIQSIPAGSTITSATLNLEVVSFQQDTDPPYLEFFGYVGNGSADLTDPDETVGAQKIGSYAPLTFALGPISVPLATDYIQSIAHEAFLGIVMWQSVDKASVDVSSLENAGSGAPATLSITFAPPVPEPSSLAALCGMALAAAALACRRRHRGRAARGDQPG
jgi:hypothetical protein